MTNAMPPDLFPKHKPSWAILGSLLVLMPVGVILLLMALTILAKPTKSDQLVLLHGPWKVFQGNVDASHPQFNDRLWSVWTLPDHGHTPPAPVWTERWYRHSFTVPEHFPRQGNAIYLGAIQSSFRIWINGTLLAQVGNLDDPEFVDFRKPRVIQVPDSLLTSEANILVLQVKNIYKGRHGPRGEILALGPADTLHDMAFRHSLTYVILGAMLFGIAFFFAVLILIVRERNLLWSFAVAVFLTGLMAFLEAGWASIPFVNPEFLERLHGFTVGTAPILILLHLLRNDLAPTIPRWLVRVSPLLLIWPFFGQLIAQSSDIARLMWWNQTIDEPTVLLICFVIFILGLRLLAKKGIREIVKVVPIILCVSMVCAEILRVRINAPIPPRLHLAGLFVLSLGMAISLALRLREVQDKTIASNNQLHRINDNLEEAVLTRTRDLQDMVQILCHDLANPVQTIQLSLDMIRTHPEKLPRHQERMDGAVSKASDLIQLVRKMRALQETKLPLVPLSLRLAVTEAWNLVSQKADEKNIDLVVRVPAEMMILSVKEAFAPSILANLFTNAVKFSENGSKIEVVATIHQNLAYVEVRDAGVGMPADMLLHLRREGKIPSRPGTAGEQGTGFGLPLVQRFVEASQGRMEIESSTRISGHSGTVIRLVLPIPSVSPIA